jgi:hypothetical protein
MQPTAHAERANQCARMSAADTVAIPLVIGLEHFLGWYAPPDTCPLVA